MTYTFPFPAAYPPVTGAGVGPLGELSDIGVFPPTGNPATDTASLVSAVTRLNTLGGGANVQLGQGTYVVNSNQLVVRNCSNFSVSGFGQGTIIQQAPNTPQLPNNTGGDIFVVADCTDFSLSNYTVDGNRDNISPITLMTASSGTNTVTVASGQGARYQVGQRLYVNGGVGSGDQALQDDNGGTGMIIRSIVKTSAGDVITFTTSLGNSYTALGGALLNDQYGPYAATSDYIYPYQTGTATVAGRALANEDQQNGIHLLNCKRFFVTGCVAKNIWESGIKCGSELGNGDGCSEGVIQGNNSHHGYDQGISIWYGDRIQVFGNETNSSGWGGIVFTSSNHCVAESNISSYHIYQVPGDLQEGHGLANEGGGWNEFSGNIVWNTNGSGMHEATPPFFTGGAGTTLTGYLAAGTAAGTSIPVGSSTNLVAGYPYSIIDGQATEQITIASVVDSTHVKLTQPTRFSHGVSAGTTPIGACVPEDNLIEGNLIAYTQVGDGINNQNCVRSRIIGNLVINCAQLGTGTFNTGICGSASPTGLPSGVKIGGDGSIIQGNTVTGCYASSMILDTATDYKVIGNTFHGPIGGSGNKAVLLQGMIDLVFQGNEVSNNEQQAGIFVNTGAAGGSVAPLRNTISNNIVRLCANEGIIVLAGEQHTVSGNIVTSCQGNAGINFRGVVNSTISDNVCTSNTNGIKIESSCSQIILKGNTAREDGTGINVTTGAALTQSHGIYDDGTCSNNIFAYNIVSSNTTAQLTVSGSSSKQNSNIISGSIVSGAL